MEIYGSQIWLSFSLKNVVIASKVLSLDGWGILGFLASLVWYVSSHHRWATPEASIYATGWTQDFQAPWWTSMFNAILDELQLDIYWLKVDVLCWCCWCFFVCLLVLFTRLWKNHVRLTCQNCEKDPHFSQVNDPPLESTHPRYSLAGAWPFHQKTSHRTTKASSSLLNP